MMKKIWREIKKQLTDTPAFVGNDVPIVIDYRQHIDTCSSQLKQALQETSSGLIFLIGPYGSGKTTQINAFFNEHPEIKSEYLSFERMASIDFAFLHLTTFFTRALFLVLSLIIGATLIEQLPTSAGLPISLVLIYFFVKNVPNLMYIFHETVKCLIERHTKVVVIEDLERSAIDPRAIWVFLANLWQYKRIYIITLGYRVEEQSEKQKIIENAIKLTGTIIDLENDERLNLEIITTVDSHFASSFYTDIALQEPSWLSLFTPREMLIIHDEMRRLQSAKTDADMKEIEQDTFSKYLMQKLELEMKDPKLKEKLLHCFKKSLR